MNSALDAEISPMDQRTTRENPQTQQTAGKHTAKHGERPATNARKATTSTTCVEHPRKKEERGNLWRELGPKWAKVTRKRRRSETKRNKQCYYGWLYLSTDSSKLTAIGDGAALLKASPRRVNTPAPLSSYHSSPQRSLLRSVLSPTCSCSSCFSPSRVFNQIASTTNLFLPYST